MITLGEFKVEEILPRIGLGFPKMRLETSTGDYVVKASSSRLECFKRNQQCVWCHRVGNVFLLQQHIAGQPRSITKCFIQKCPWCALHPKRKINSEVPHLNLYHRSKKGQLLLMTQDHIKPQWAHGSDEQENLQTMCRECNSRKGGALPEEININIFPFWRFRK